jgi:hypothetical protein
MDQALPFLVVRRIQDFVDLDVGNQKVALPRRYCPPKSISEADI